MLIIFVREPGKLTLHVTLTGSSHDTRRRFVFVLQGAEVLDLLQDV